MVTNARVTAGGEVLAVVDGHLRRVGTFTSIEAAQQFAEKINESGRIPNDY